MAEKNAGSLQVMLVEDDPLTLFVLQNRITNLGHNVVAKARTGREAIQQASQCQPDLILMDIRMPDLDGIEAAKAIMAKQPTAIIMITAYSDQETMERAQQAGAIGYLVKPVSDYQLEPAIQAAWHGAKGNESQHPRMATH